MEITLIRHAKVKYGYKPFYRHFEFDKACKEYDNSPVIVDMGYKCHCVADTVYVSGLQRTHDTAELILSNKELIEDNIFNEVPIKSFAPLPFPIPAALWFFVGRLLWALGLRQPETRGETKIRARKAADILEKEYRPVVLVGHGVFMRVLVKELISRGYLISGKAQYRNLDEIHLYK